MRVKRKTLHKTLILAVALTIGGYAGCQFHIQRAWVDPVYVSPKVTKITSLGAYEPSLVGTVADSLVYIFDSGIEGATAFIMGGTHPNEPAGILSAYLLLEHMQVTRGRVIVLPIANASAATSGVVGNGTVPFFTIGQRTFRLGGRLVNPLDQWPDAPVYVQYPSGQHQGMEEIRNLNRAYPGRSNGTLIERVAHAITNLIQSEEVTYAFDLHEASVTYPINNTIITQEGSCDLAFLAQLLLEQEGLSMRVELASDSLQGYSYTQWAKLEGVQPFLIEVPNPSQDRISGPSTQELVTQGTDEFLLRASQAGFTGVPMDENGFPLEHRCALHLEAIKAILQAGSMVDPDHAIQATWPSYGQIAEVGLGDLFK